MIFDDLIKLKNYQQNVDADSNIMFHRDCIANELKILSNSYINLVCLFENLLHKNIYVDFRREIIIDWVIYFWNYWENVLRFQ